MLHVFDDCANEHYQRTLAVTNEESHQESSATVTKRKVVHNQRAG